MLAEYFDLTGSQRTTGIGFYQPLIDTRRESRLMQEYRVARSRAHP